MGGNGAGSARQQVHRLCNLDSGPLLSLSVTTTFLLGRITMPDKDPFEGESPAYSNPNSDN